MDDNELMEKMKVPKAVAKMAIPSVISSLVTVVYNMADTFFVLRSSLVIVSPLFVFVAKYLIILFKSYINISWLCSVGG